MIEFSGEVYSRSAGKVMEIMVGQLLKCSIEVEVQEQFSTGTVLPSLAKEELKKKSSTTTVKRNHRSLFFSKGNTFDVEGTLLDLSDRF